MVYLATQRLRQIALVLAAVGAGSQPALSLDDTYLRCKGSIAIVYPSGVYSEKTQELAAHVLQDRVSFSGNALLYGRDIQICDPSRDDFYFDSHSCTGVADLSRPRQYGTFNKITGELRLTNEVPRPDGPRLFEGNFICKKAEPLMK